MSTDQPAPAAARTEPTTVPWRVVALSFLAVLLDGFDTASLAFAVPTLARQWAMAPAAFTFPLVLTNIGVVVGYLGCGALGARFGRRRLLVGGVLVFAVGTLCTAVLLPAVHSIAALSVVRLVTGLGLGVVLPVAVSLSADQSPARRRELVSVTVTLGLASGGTLGGFVGGPLISTVGTAGVFWIGGLAPVVLALLMARWLPEPPAATGPDREAARDRARDEARVGRLFAPALRTNTALLWAFAFLVFVAAYTLTSWVPTFLTGYGFSASQAPLGLAFVHLGGVLGGIVLIPLAARIGVTRALVLMPALAAVCMVVASRAGLDGLALLLVLGGAGAGVTAGQIGQLALAVALYPTGARTTGVGWAAALGRVGSIVGPGVAGILLALALSGQNIIALTAIPVVAAVGAAAALWLRTHRV
ncbi:MFS transporter [Pseudonocardia acaciae]|uniref:MFS transporter n=1 Tax=Pseudonocardia acaciae TaxID=551276 RepID=UPI00048B0F77|nr:MFS transporter [Pseudonocardia acaciae]